MHSAPIVLIEGFLAVVLVELVIGRYSPWPNWKPTEIVHWLTAAVEVEVRYVVFCLCYVLDVTRWVKLLPLEEFASVISSLIEILVAPFLAAKDGVMDYMISPFSQMLIEKCGKSLAQSALQLLVFLIMIIIIGTVLQLLDYYKIVDVKLRWYQFIDYIQDLDRRLKLAGEQERERQQTAERIAREEVERLQRIAKDPLHGYNTRRRHQTVSSVADRHDQGYT